MKEKDKATGFPATRPAAHRVYGDVCAGHLSHVNILFVITWRGWLVIKEIGASRFIRLKLSKVPWENSVFPILLNPITIGLYTTLPLNRLHIYLNQWQHDNVNT